MLRRFVGKVVAGGSPFDGVEPMDVDASSTSTSQPINISQPVGGGGFSRMGAGSMDKSQGGRLVRASPRLLDAWRKDKGSPILMQNSGIHMRGPGECHSFALFGSTRTINGMEGRAQNVALQTPSGMLLDTGGLLAQIRGKDKLSPILPLPLAATSSLHIPVETRSYGSSSSLGSPASVQRPTFGPNGNLVGLSDMRGDGQVSPIWGELVIPQTPCSLGSPALMYSPYQQQQKEDENTIPLTDSSLGSAASVQRPIFERGQDHDVPTNSSWGSAASVQRPTIRCAKTSSHEVGEGALLTIPLIVNSWSSPSSGKSKHTAAELFNLQSSPSLAAKALPSEEELDAEAEVLKAIQNKQEQEDEVEKGDGRRGGSKMAAELDPDTLSQDDYTSYSPAAMQDGLVCLPVEEDDEEGPSAIEIARQLAELEQDVPVKKERTGKEVLAAEAKGLHLEHIRDGLIQFSPCKCKHAGSLGVLSCLMQFSSMDMMALHKEAYGGVLVGDKGLAASAVASRVHTLMWQMAEELPRKDAWGRSHTISDWRIHGKSVCRKNWERAYGVSERRLRTLYHFVARGIDS